MSHEEAVSGTLAERYLLRELDTETRDQFEEHLFVCPECAAAVTTASAFLETGREVVSPRPEPPAETEQSPRRPWQERKGYRWFWPVPAGAWAAGLAACTLSMWVGTRWAPASAPLGRAPALFLSVARSGQPKKIVLRDARESVHLTLAPPQEEAAARYTVELRRGNQTVAKEDVAPEGGGELSLRLDSALVPPGEYRIVVRSGPNGRDREYRFATERAER